jgi:hypothetical protein
VRYTVGTMTVHLTLASESETVQRLVADFARGLGCSLEASPGRVLRAALPDGGDALIDLLTHVAFSAIKAGVDVSEPLCKVTYRHPNVSSEVTLALRVTEFDIGRASSSAV